MITVPVLQNSPENLCHLLKLSTATCSIKIPWFTIIIYVKVQNYFNLHYFMIFWTRRDITIEGAAIERTKYSFHALIFKSSLEPLRQTHVIDANKHMLRIGYCKRHEVKDCLAVLKVCYFRVVSCQYLYIFYFFLEEPVLFWLFCDV